MPLITELATEQRPSLANTSEQVNYLFALYAISG